MEYKLFVNVPETQAQILNKRKSIYDLIVKKDKVAIPK